MSPSRRETTVAVGCCIAAMMCFSSVPVFLRHLTGYLDAWTVNAVRYGTSAVFWLPFVLVLSRRSRRPAPNPARRSVWLAALVPVAPNLIGQVGWATCPYYLDAPTIGFLIRTSFLFTAVLGFLFIPAERPLGRRPLFLLGAALCMGGVFLMYVERLPAGSFGEAKAWIGLGIALGTALCWGGYAIGVRTFLHGYRLRLAFGVVSLYTAAGLVALVLMVGRYEQLARLPGREWALLIGSAFLGIAFGHVLYYRGIHGIGPVVASGTMMAGAFWTYLLAVLFLGETMTRVQLLGGVGVVLGGLALVRARAQVQKLPGAEGSGEERGRRAGPLN
jgi:drug/metabolite transporter (DMT)-like permease